MRFKQRSLGVSDSSLFFPTLVLCLAAALWTTPASGAAPPAQPGEALALQRQEPTQPASPAPDAAPGLINLDFVVTDKSGKPIHGLVLKDFTLLDNHQPQKILSFHSFDEVSAKLDPPVEVILVVDTIKMPFTLAADERVEVEKFLRQSSGHLAQPISIFGISDSGLWKLAQPSGDGNALAAEIAEDKLMFIRRLLEKKTGEYADSLSPGDPAGLSALKALGDIATSERRKPGRKVLIWIGPGWGVGTVGGTVRLQLTYLDFLNGVQSVQQASLKNLDRRVLAVQSGGRVLGPTNDLVSQIDRCIQETSAFYTLSFDPSHADHPGEYHSIEVQVGVPGLFGGPRALSEVSQTTRHKSKQG